MTARVFMPGIANTCSPAASTQASASCGAVQPLRRANSRRASTNRRLCAPLSPLKRGMAAANVICRQFIDNAEIAGQKTAAERTVGNKADAELLAGREHAVFGFARPERVFGLNGCDRMHGMRAAQRVDAALR